MIKVGDILEWDGGKIEILEKSRLGGWIYKYITGGDRRPKDSSGNIYENFNQ